ncbi:malignant T cell-amplified sequence 1-like protein [Zopfochytrium polystomum]|nr:malignant T cell-amplified sequence 1-like protein [Zopfochytrium polystomum]
MFKKFSSKESISGQTQLKSSVQRVVRSKILEQYPALEPFLEELMPKKAPIFLIKCQDALNLISVNNVVLFFNHFEGPYFPTLRLLHKYPDILPKFQVDRGAIKFVISGAQIMCPGLTSKGAQLDESVPTETAVAIYAEGKQNALGVGLTKLSAQDIKRLNKGVGVENMHCLYDGLWKMTSEGS